MFSKILPTSRFFSKLQSQNVLGQGRFLSHAKPNQPQTKSSMYFQKMAKKLSFEEFKEANVKSYESYKESALIKSLHGNDLEKIKKAYDEYCILKYNRYTHSIHGGNPATML